MTVQNGDILKVVVEALLDDGTIAQNVFYFLADFLVPWSDAAVLSFLGPWVEALMDNVEASIVDTVTWNDIVADIIEWDVDHWETTYHVGTEAIDTASTATGDQAPNQVASFATFNTTRPKSKGRKFLYAFDEVNFTGSFLTAGTVTAMTNYATDAMDTIVIAALSTLTPGIVRATENTFLAFLSAVVTNVVGTQRRRRPGVGI